MTWLAARRAAATLVGDFGAFAAANVAFALVAAVGAAATSVYPPAAVLGVAAVPVACGLMRMAACAVRDMPVRARHLLDGAAHRLWPHLALALGQAVVLTVAVLNVTIALQRGGALYATAAVVSGYVAAAVLAVATTTWPLLLDPRRTGVGVGRLLRLGVGVALSRPITVIAVTLIEVALVGVAAHTPLALLVVPAFGALVAAHLSLPVADRLENLNPDAPGRRPGDGR